MNKFIKQVIGICLFCFLTGITSCDNLLNVEVHNSITNESYWKSEGDVTGYLTGIHYRFREVMNSTYFFEDRGDAFEPGLEGSVSEAWSQVLTESNAPLWRNYYNLIHHCNLVIKYAPAITPNTTNIERAIAEAYFFRAYTYFILVRMWGDVPIVLEPTESDQSPLPARSPATQVMNEVILQDINNALEKLPEEGFRNKNRVSKPLVYAALTDILLWKAKVTDKKSEDLLQALAASDHLMDAGLSLVDFTKIHATDNKKNSEIIFALNYQRDEKSDHYGSRLKARDIFVSSAVNVDEIAFSKSGARSVYAPSEKFMNSFLNPNDVRKDASFIVAKNNTGETIGIFDNKFRGTLYEDDRYWDNDHVIYRLGEIILFRAEIFAAMGGTGNLEKAVTELNKIRHRANTGDYSGPLDKESIEREIFNERFRELWFEFKRWPDIVRFHHGGTINAYTEVPNLADKTIPLFFPVNIDELSINPNLTQTNGY